MSRDFYKILGVTHNATDSDLNKAHRRLALKYHPDKSRAPDALERFKEIQGAYEVLINKGKREAYDRALAAKTNASHDKNLQQFRRHCFRESETNYFASRGPRDGGGDDGVDVPPGVYRLHVSLEELFKGGLVEVTIATGFKGTDRDHGGNLTVILRLTSGLREGDTMTFSPSGKPLHQPTPGAATFIVIQKPHALFERRHDDLVFKYAVLDSQASAGCTIQVPLIEGGTMRLTLAAGEVNSGTVVRIPCKGMPRPSWPWCRGDLLVEFDVLPRSAKNGSSGTGSRALRLTAALLAAVGPLAAAAYWYCCGGPS